MNERRRIPRRMANQPPRDYQCRPKGSNPGCSPLQAILQGPAVYRVDIGHVGSDLDVYGYLRLMDIYFTWGWAANR